MVSLTVGRDSIISLVFGASFSLNDFADLDTGLPWIVVAYIKDIKTSFLQVRIFNGKGSAYSGLSISSDNDLNAINGRITG
ncbi:hypothetical protein PoB_005912700 [Plakobranchus ocellatus]|uniref:Uncharacterized protein n=1 Tax=Plakobranchus ocellatus TaxID=259542 RepID=A0AAV4CLB4_9GAST|nr:hypothetical protein PoB_005912700 [Plakobranchus ocellatus]